MNFDGYRRPDGKTGTRNFVLVIPSVGCSQGVARAIARGLKNVVYLPNILGCGQIGEDRMLVKKTLVGFGTTSQCLWRTHRRERMRTTCRRVR